MKTIAERLAMQLSGEQRERICRGRSAARADRRRHPAGAADAARRGRRRRADRVRERRQPAAGARVGAREGNRHPHRARRRARASRAADAGREPRPRGRRRRARPAARVSRRSTDPDPGRRQHSARAADITHRSDRARVCALAFRCSPACCSALRPAWQAARTGVGEALKEGGRSSSAGGGRWVRSASAGRRSGALDRAARGRRAASAQLCAPDRSRSGLRSRARAGVPGRSADYGIPVSRPSHRLLRHAAREARRAARRSARRHRAAPAAARRLCAVVRDPGPPPPKPGEEPVGESSRGQPRLFQTLGIPLRRGRLFTSRDAERAPMVAVVDEAFAGRHFPDEDPIGNRLDIGNGSDGALRNRRRGRRRAQQRAGFGAVADDVRAVQAGRLQHDVGRGARRR